MNIGIDPWGGLRSQAGRVPVGHAVGAGDWVGRQRRLDPYSYLSLWDLLRQSMVVEVGSALASSGKRADILFR